MKHKHAAKAMVFISLLSALAFVSVFFIQIPLIPSAAFLKFDVRDAIIMLGGIIYGPFAAFMGAFVSGILQFVLTGEAGIIGFFMNLISSVSFVCTASIIYKFGKNYKFLFAGLIAGCVLMTANMLLWNYLITPLFMGVPREIVGSMLFTVFMPFNLLKGCLNAAIVLLYYKGLGGIRS